MPVIIILIIIVVIMSIKCVKVIQQSTVGIIMRLGKFHKKADTGVHFLVPFIDTLSYRIDLKERVEDFPPQPVITKDNVTMQIDTVVFFQITDPKLFAYGVENPIMDFAVSIDRLPKTDSMSVMHDYLWQSGGNASSAIAALARLGAKCSMLGVVGTDEFGTFCRDDMVRHGVDVSH